MTPIRLAALAVLALTGACQAQDRLPDGGIATADGNGAVQAWYGQPTTRYDHGILGDAIEGGSLVALDSQGQRHELTLPDRFVFEDLTPRLVDLDGDGINEVVTIRTDIAAGAAVAVYGIVDDQLVERAATAPIGLPHRWLSIAAIANFSANPGKEIAIVKTPHIGGVLEILSLQGDTLRLVRAPQSGFSTHFIGSRDLSLAHAEDTDGDGFFELALPNQQRTKVVVLGFEPDTHIVGTLASEGVVSRPIGSFSNALTVRPISQ